MMNENPMLEALRLTRAGDPAGATRAIQDMLAGKSATPEASPRVVDGGLIDLTAKSVSYADTPDAKPQDRQPDQRKTESPKAEGADIFRDAVFESAQGSLQYKLFLPAGLPANAPLVVMLHGCTQNPDDFARGTGMNDVARTRGFAVAWPSQPQSANMQRCWNWFEAGHQKRGQGEPALIAGMTQDVVSRHGLDPRRVFVAGLSAGGAAAALMAAAYPDVYAAAGVHSGLACGAAKDMPGALKAMGKGRGGAARGGTFVPTIVFHGDQDSTVNKANGGEVFADALAAAGGALQVRTEAGVEEGLAYTRTVASDAAGRSRAELWAIKGGQHAWSGGSRSGSHTDPRGPDASREMARFFLDQAG